VQKLAELIADAHFSVSVDTHTMTADMQAAMRSMQADIRKQAAYVVSQGCDCCLGEQVQEAGGSAS